MSINEAEHNQARIEQLTVAPPAIRTRRSQALAIVRNFASVVAFLALGIGLLAVTQGQQTRDQQATTACVESNRVRAQVETLWQYIIDESRKANPNPTTKQSADLARFQTKVTDIYAPRKC